MHTRAHSGICTHTSSRQLILRYLGCVHGLRDSIKYPDMPLTFHGGQGQCIIVCYSVQLIDDEFGGGSRYCRVQALPVLVKAGIIQNNFRQRPTEPWKLEAWSLETDKAGSEPISLLTGCLTLDRSLKPLSLCSTACKRGTRRGPTSWR